MKKLLLSFAILSGGTVAIAQTAVGTPVGNFTLQDINGNTHTLYDYLDQGKMVVIDVSATWCSPCWAYHNTGALNDFYNAHGPSGDNTAMAFFIEGDVTTNSADLNGTGTNTQGDWVTGENMPIIDLTTSASFTNSGMSIDYFPEMYVICPNRTILASGVAGSIGTLANLNSYLGQCPAVASQPTDPAFLGYSGTTTSCGSFDLGVTLQNNGTNPLTSCTISVTGIPSPINYNWTGTLNTYDFVNVSLGTITISSPATAHITVTTTDADPTNSTMDQTLNYIDPSQTTAVNTLETFSASGFPYANWQVVNPDGGMTWEITSTSPQGNTLFINTFNYSATGELDHVVTPAYDLTGQSTPSLNFKYANRRYDATYYDKLIVGVSTNCSGPFTPVWSKQSDQLATGADMSSEFTSPAAADFANVCIDLTNYANAPALFVRFTNENHYGNNIYIDDIQISSSNCATITAGITENNAVDNLKVYPNPFSSEATISFETSEAQEVTIEVMNMLGEVVKVNNLGEVFGVQNITIDGSTLDNGIYMINIKVGDKVSTARVVLNK